MAKQKKLSGKTKPKARSGRKKAVAAAPAPPRDPQARARAALAHRRANRPEQIDNSSLYAGSPMYFYCRSCGHLADTKPESYVTPPKRLCDGCQTMADNGWLE